jgi:2-polyprenyl-3-methyl-5-hydroxy-6-metoxy-1,4-benzoquinol methylase
VGELRLAARSVGLEVDILLAVIGPGNPHPKGLAPVDLLDVGTGRGTFLWPLLAEFPELPVAVLDLDERRARDLEATRAGGVSRLAVHCGDVCATELDSGYADVVTALEVLEHIPSPSVAALQLVRLARRALIVSVPSKADDNPAHLHLFDQESLSALFTDAGAEKASVEFVLNHMVALVRVGS